MQLSVLSVRMR